MNAVISPFTKWPSAPLLSLLLIGLWSTIFDRLLATPLLLALQRYLQLGLQKPGMSQFGSWRTIVRFWLYSILIVAPVALTGLARGHNPWSEEHRLFVKLIMVCASLYLYIRLYFLLPATAADSPYATPRAAFRLSIGQGWKIVKVILLTFAPVFVVIVVAAIVVIAQHWGPDQFASPFNIVLLFFGSIYERFEKRVGFA